MKGWAFVQHKVTTTEVQRTCIPCDPALEMAGQVVWTHPTEDE